MGKAQFEHTDFLRAARDIVVAEGPAAVTVGSVTARLRAPVGSFYHRFASRDVLLGELWLATVLAFQEGSTAAIERGDFLGAALHTPRWARAHLPEACFLLLYHRNDFLRGEWPAALKRAVDAQARRVEESVEKFARAALGGASAERRRRAAFLMIDVPLAAVRPHLLRREAPPPLVDRLIEDTYRALVEPITGGQRTARRRR